jgi:glutamate transport system substrate-binding protein
MNRRRWWLIALLLVVALIGAACGDDDDEPTGQEDTTETTAAGPPEFEAGSTMAAIQEKGKLIVGTKVDQPGFGLKNPTSGEIEGFDVEIAKLIAVGIFGGSVDDLGDKVEFTETPTPTREDNIEQGRVDMIAATYTITDKRKERIDYAGPYFITGQDIMVKADDTSIKSVEDLNGKKVCTAPGSTSEINLKAKAPQADLSLLSATYSDCAAHLSNGRVQAVSTDQPILIGLVVNNAGAFKVLSKTFSIEPYGIGLKKGDDDFREFINNRLEEIFESGEWEEAFAKTLGSESNIKLATPEAPKVDRYTSGAAPAATTTTTAP